MGLIDRGMVFGLGYLAGTPEGRRQLAILRSQVRRLGRHPGVTRLRERGWDFAEAQTTRALRSTPRRTDVVDHDGPADVPVHPPSSLVARPRPSSPDPGPTTPQEHP